MFRWGGSVRVAPQGLSKVFRSVSSKSPRPLMRFAPSLPKLINVPTPTLLREKEALEVYALLKCSDDEYGKALEMAQKLKSGDSSMPTGPQISEKIVLAAGALQHLPTPKRPPINWEFNDHEMLLIPAPFVLGHAWRISPLPYLSPSPQHSTASYISWPGVVGSPHPWNGYSGVSPRRGSFRSLHN